MWGLSSGQGYLVFSPFLSRPQCEVQWGLKGTLWASLKSTVSNAAFRREASYEQAVKLWNVVKSVRLHAF